MSGDGEGRRLPLSLTRGYSLVEMMLALVVLGLILGGSLVPLHHAYEERQVDKVNSHLQEARSAVLGYAVQNRTGLERRVTLSDGDPPITIPGGRPYLPCPDVDDDGIEDREDLPETQRDVDLVAVEGDETPPGECLAQKGLLPWRTLGMSNQYDVWGSRLVYGVDQAFSGKLMGFDESFRADIFDRAKPARVDTSNGRINLSVRVDPGDAGIIVCSSAEGGCPNSDLSNVIAGLIVTTDITLGSRVVPAFDDGRDEVSGIVEGAVFVILSHGRNARGAVGRVGCSKLKPLKDAEKINAYYGEDNPIVKMPGALKNCDELSLPKKLKGQNLYIKTPFSEESDDFLVWMGKEELLGYLVRGGAFPIEALEELPK